MKKLLLVLFTCLSLLSFSQAPQEISYQGVARNSSGTILASQNIGIKLDLHQGSSGGTIVFSETHNKTTNSFGLFTLGIGSVNSSSFSSINWANGPYFLEVSIDPTGGVSYISVGTQQFMSVPYALYAQTAGNASSTPTITINAPNTVSSAGGSYTINIPASTTYTAGSGININTGVITSTANIVGAGSTSVTGTYPNLTISTPTTQVYTAGPGIDISTSGVISNTATAITPTITAGNNITINPTTPSYSYTVSAPTYSLSQTGNNIDLLQNGASIGTATLPVVTSYSAGNGINISGNVISNTLTPITPTLSVTGNTISINPGNTQTLPTYSLTQSGSNIDLMQNGASIATVTLTASTSTSLSAGSPNILLNQSGNAYTITPVIPTFTNVGSTTITGSYPNYTVNSVASPTTTLVQGNNVSLNQSGSTYTVSVPSPSFATNGPTSISGSYPNYTVNSIASPTTSLVAGNTNIQLLPGANSYTLNAYTYSLTNNSNTLTLTNGAPSGYTSTVVVPVGPTYTAGPGISISSGTIINTSPGITSTITGTGNAFVATSGSSYTVNVPTQTLTVTGNSVITSNLGGSATISPASLTYTSASNTLKLTDGLSSNTYTLNNYTAGTGISISGSAPNFVITNTAVISTPTITGTGIASVTTAGNTFTVNVPAPTYTPASGVLGFGTNTLAIAPTLSLTGTTLTSGALTNSVNLSSLNGIYGGSGAIQTGSTTVTVATNTLTFLSGTTANKPIANFFGGGITGTHLAIGHIAANPATIKLLGSVNTTPVDYGYVSGSSNGISMSGGTSSNGLFVTNSAEVGIGTYTTGTGKFVVTSAASSTAPTAHFRETGVSQLVRLKLSNTNVSGKYFEIASDNNGTDANAAFSVNYHNGSNYRPVFLITGDYKAVVHNMNTALASLHVMDTTNNGGGIASEGFNRPGVLVLARNNQPGFGSRLAVSAGDELGRISFSGYTGGSYGGGPKIFARAIEAYTGSGNGSELVFTTVPIGTASQLEVMKLQSNGNVVINPTQFTNAILDVKGSMRLDSTLTMAGHNNIPFQSPLNEGRIYFDRPSGKFKVSENGGAYVDLISPGANIWSSGVNTVFLANTISKVGIGTTTPSSLLHVVSSVPAPSNLMLGNVNQPNIEWEWRVDGVSNLSLNNENNGSPFTSLFVANSGKIGINTTSPAAQLAIANTFTSSEGVFVDNNSNTNGVRVYQGGSGSGFFSHIGTAAGGSGFIGMTQANSAFFSGTSFGAGRTAEFFINNSTNSNSVIYASTNGTGNAIYAINTNSLNTASVIQASSNSSGVAIYANNSGGSTAQFDNNTSSATFNAINTSNGMAVYASANSGNAINASSSGSVNPTALINNSGTGDGMQVFSTGNRAILAQSSSNGTAALEVNNTGNGNAITVIKGGTATSGNAGSFTSSSSSNTADGVIVNYSGAAAAIHAVSATTSTVGLWVQNGHLKSTGTAPTTSSISISGGGLTAAVPSLSNATDVKGKLTAVITTTLNVNSGNNTTIRVTFNKGYSVAPTVVVTPLTDLLGMSYFVTNVTPTSFDLTLKNNLTTSISTPASWTVNFNYMVIE